MHLLHMDLKVKNKYNSFEIPATVILNMCWQIVVIIAQFLCNLEEV